MIARVARGVGCPGTSAGYAGLGGAWFRQFRPMSLDWPRATEPRQYTLAPRDRKLPTLELGRAPRRRTAASCAAPTRGSQQAALLAKRKRVTNALDIAAAGASTSASVAMAFPPPWGQIAAACGYVTAAGLKIAGALRRKGDLALQGDDRAIAGWVRRMARWSKTKRARRATQIRGTLARLEEKCRRKGGGRGTRLQVQLARTRLKAAALVGVYAEARKEKRRRAPLVEGDPRTAADVTETDPSASVDTAADDIAPNAEADGAASFSDVPGYVVVGGALAVALVIAAIFLGTSGGAPAPAPRRERASPELAERVQPAPANAPSMRSPRAPYTFARRAA